MARASRRLLSILGLGLALASSAQAQSSQFGARGLGLPAWLDAVQAERPDWPVRELEDVLEALERARFAPLAGDDAAELVDRADQLVERLTAPAEGDAA